MQTIIKETVFKYPLRCPAASEIQRVLLPQGAEVLTVADQPEGIKHNIFLWALVDPRQPDEDRYFAILGTGRDLLPYAERDPSRLFDKPGSFEYINTFFMNARLSCAHAFEFVLDGKNEGDECATWLE